MRRLFAGFTLALTLTAGSLSARATHASPLDAPVDLSNKPVHLQYLHQDPLGGTATPQQLPLDRLPAGVRDLFTTPVGASLDSFWSATAAPALCNAATSMLNGKGKGSFHLYNVGCNLAQSGSTTAWQDGDKVVVSYKLPNNVITAWVTTPATCAPGHGTFLCPTDPELSLTADIELDATIESPGTACALHADPFEVRVSNVVLDSQNFTADIAKDAASLWSDITGTDYISMAQNMVQQGADGFNTSAVQGQQTVLGKVNAFTSTLCGSLIPVLGGADDMWLLTASVDPVQGIVLQLTDEPPTPSLFRPVLNPAQPAVLPGSVLQLSGQYFSGKASTVTFTLGSTALGTATVSSQGTFTGSVTIPAGTPAGPITIHAVAGTETADATVQVLAASGAPTLITSFQGHPISSVSTDSAFTLTGAGFMPAPSVSKQRFIVGSLEAAQVTIYLDSTSGPQLGTAFAGADGTFTTDITVTAAQIGNVAGQHTLIAVQGNGAQATLTLAFVLPEVIH